MSKISKNCTIVAKKDDAKIYDTETRKLITVAKKFNDLYYVNSILNNRNNVSNNESSLSNNENEAFVNSVKLTEKERWHRNLGHVNFNYLNKIVKNKLLDGSPEKIENL